jgi:hypothetical protein
VLTITVGSFSVQLVLIERRRNTKAGYSELYAGKTITGTSKPVAVKLYLSASTGNSTIVILKSAVTLSQSSLILRSAGFACKKKSAPR